MTLRVRGLTAILACAGLVCGAVAVAASGVIQRRDGPPSRGPAARQMRAFAAPRSAATAVPDPARGGLAQMPGVQIEHARQLISGIGTQGYAVSAAPTSNGGVCTAGPVGGGCFPEFDSNGIAFSTGMDNDGPASPTDRELIAGVASDDVRRIDAVTNAGKLAVPLRNNAFIYEAPAVGVWADALEVTFVDGSKTRAVVANANRVEPIP